jgi:hypothetical protein
MFVGLVYSARTGAVTRPVMLSDGKPVAGSVSATIDFQVSRA